MVKISKSNNGSKSKSKSKSKRRVSSSSCSRTKGPGGICMNALLNYSIIGAIVIGFLIIMVKVLTPVSEKEVEGNSSKTLCLIHSESCGHCKKMMPEWTKFYKTNKTNVNIKTLEARKDEDEIETIKKKFGIKVDGYPTIYLLDGETNTAEEYSGGRKCSDFEAFCGKK